MRIFLSYKPNLRRSFSIVRTGTTFLEHDYSTTSSSISIASFKRPKMEIDYRNKKILAPMVRVGTLPFRLLALQYGCDIAYSEELIDRALCKTTRVVNEQTNTIDYVSEKGGVLWSTCPADKPSVLQIGTADPEYALKAAQHLYQDYDAVDINMGCPVHFSVSGGMGSALLKEPEKVKQILTTLVRNIDKPVTCKIRLLDTMDKTIDFVKMVEQTGVRAIAVHGRYVDQRPREPAHMHLLRHIVDAVSIPVIANGDMFQNEDPDRIRELTGCASVMIGRGAMWNCSVFAPPGKRVSEVQVAREYVDKCLQYGNRFQFTKYTLLKMFDESKHKKVFYPHILKAKTHEELKEALMVVDLAQLEQAGEVEIFDINNNSAGATVTVTYNAREEDSRFWNQRKQEYNSILEETEAKH